MSLQFSLRVMCIQQHGIDPETGKPPEGKMKELIEKMKEAKKIKDTSKPKRKVSFDTVKKALGAEEIDDFTPLFKKSEEFIDKFVILCKQYKEFFRTDKVAIQCYSKKTDKNISITIEPYETKIDISDYVTSHTFVTPLE